MKLILNNFKPNGLISEHTYCSSDMLIDWPTEINQNHLQDIKYMRVLYDYSEPWTLESDVFQYMNENSLNILKNENCIFVFDNSMEGWSPYENPVVRSLHNSALKHEIDLRKIYYLTSNYLDSSCYNNFLLLFEYQTGMNIVYNTLVGDMTISGNIKTLENHIKEFEENHVDKFFLHLSRRNRPHRVMANYMISNSEIKDYGLISQDKLSRRDTNALLNEYRNSPLCSSEINRDSINEWNKNCLPLIVDYTDFNINWAGYSNPELYSKTVFSVVLETSINDRGSTALFVSEKTFKPIVNRQPFVIFGNRGINHHLNSLGFKTYEKWFDISCFDFDTDPVSRYKKILEITKNTVDHLKNMSIKERSEWRFMFSEVLNYNYDLVINKVIRQREAESLHQTIKSYFDGKFYSQLTSLIRP